MIRKFSLLGAFVLAMSDPAGAFELKVTIPERVCPLPKLVADGKTVQTEPIQKAIDQCAQQGGGTLRFPAGQYLSGPLFLRSNLRLHLEAGARLLASTEREIYRVTPQNEKYAVMQGWIAFLNAVDEHDIALTGPGVIDGQGQPWWDFYLQKSGKSTPTNRPRLIYFGRVRNALLEDVTLTNSPSFHFVPHASENIEVNRVKILAPAHSPNTDAIDPSNTRNMLIHNCEIDTGDDNIAIKAGSIDPQHPGAAVENITVADCVFRAGHGASIGTETVGGVRNVVFERIRFIGTDHAIRIKSSRKRSGEIRNIIYRDLTLDNVGDAILLTGYYPKIPDALQDTEPPYQSTTPYYHDIIVQNVKGSSQAPGYIVGLPERTFHAIRLDNVHLDTSGPLPVRNASISLHDVKIGTGVSPVALETQAEAMNK